MTSEVCLMNRRAALLAADSAVSVTHWNDGDAKEHYFKGANKIFQVSAHHPVGMMIFDSADIARVPWEIVAKDFRSHLSNKSFNSLEGYANEFFEWLGTANRFFPDDVQKEIFLSTAQRAALVFLMGDHAEQSSSIDERRKALDEALVARHAELDGMGVAAGLDAVGLASAMATHGDELKTMIEEFAEELELPLPSYPKSLVEAMMAEIYKRPDQWMTTSGIVFAGFGEHEIFPQMVSYKSCGLIGGKHVAKEEDRESITHDNLASIKAFAQTSMSDTFSIGFDKDVFHLFSQSVQDGMREFAKAFAVVCGKDPAEIDDLSELVESARSKICKTVINSARSKHGAPLRRILGSLSIEEMAELAETLINLQSLKEKVTKPSASVGGPVDIAAVTRGEGLIWVKRKHYFDPALNPRYLSRQDALYR